MTRYVPQWLQAGSYAASQDRRLIAALWPGPASSGCAVTSVGGGMALNVAAGQVAVPSPNNTGSSLCSSDATEVVNIPAAPPSGQNRIDLVTCHPRGADLDGGTNNDFIFDVITGTAAANPVAPAVPNGQVALAQVYVGGGVASIAQANITDVRPGAMAVAGLANLPPALGAGAALASFTDGAGVVWVAKGGVNGGAWRRATDVLHARYYRSAAFTFPAAATAFGYDTVIADDYGLYAPASGIATFPLGGLWRMEAGIGAAGTGTAAQNRVEIWDQADASGALAAGVAAAGAAFTAALCAWQNRIAAGVQWQTRMASSAAGGAGRGLRDTTRLFISYLGTG